MDTSKDVSRAKGSELINTQQTTPIKKGGRAGNRNNSLLRAKRMMDNVISFLNEFPELKGEMVAAREKLLLAYVEHERQMGIKV